MRVVNSLLKMLFSLLFTILICCMPIQVLAQAVHANSTTVALLNINSAIGPGVGDYVQRGIKTANRNNDRLIILQIDTPGGLSTSMRTIIKAMLESKVPVVGYVAPSGAQAASAGTFIMYAASLAVMAPGTNLGAATPVNVTSPAANDKTKQKSAKKSASQAKALNDARAYIRSLAQIHGRNAKWAESAVVRATSLSANEALKRNVINFIAKDINELLQKADGRKVIAANSSVILQTKGLRVVPIVQDWRSRFLAIITDPSVAYILLMIGFYGLLFEFMHPGVIVPGVVGTICLVLALYAFQLLPISFAALGLIILGLAFLVAEAFLPSFGILGLGGIVSFVVGSIMLLQTDQLGFGIPLTLIIGATVITVLFLIFVFQLAWRSRRRKVVSGQQAMIGHQGSIVIDKQIVWVKVDGELWRVCQPEQFSAGQMVEITAVHGLKLEVKPLQK